MMMPIDSQCSGQRQGQARWRPEVEHGTGHTCIRTHFVSPSVVALQFSQKQSYNVPHSVRAFFCLLRSQKPQHMACVLHCTLAQGTAPIRLPTSVRLMLRARTKAGMIVEWPD